MQVVHLTSAHPRYDARIFYKECAALFKAGYSVSLIVADGLGNELRNGIQIIDVGASSGRLDRVINATRRVKNAAMRLGAGVYHIHDPELIPCGLALKRLGKTVIFDAHEDVPQQLLAKPYLNKYLGRLISAIFRLYENYSCRKLDAVVGATPHITGKFLALGCVAINVNNFPRLDEFNKPERSTDKTICYVGSIAKIRGIQEIIDALCHVTHDVELLLAGRFVEPEVERAVRQSAGWGKVRELGWLDREKVARMISQSSAGLVTLHPVPSYLDSLPVKMFEYMCAGIPVIASDFTLWRTIIDAADCGLCVDPLDVEAIAAAVDYLLNNPQEAVRLGRNGRLAVEKRYHWGYEEEKLIALYKRF